MAVAMKPPVQFQRALKTGKVWQSWRCCERKVHETLKEKPGLQQKTQTARHRSHEPSAKS